MNISATRAHISKETNLKKKIQYLMAINLQQRLVQRPRHYKLCVKFAQDVKVPLLEHWGRMGLRQNGYIWFAQNGTGYSLWMKALVKFKRRMGVLLKMSPR